MGNVEKGRNYGKLKSDNLYYLTECVKEVHMIANDADDVLLLNIMCFDDHFSVKGVEIEVRHKESINVHCLVKDVDADVGSEDNYLVP